MSGGMVAWAHVHRSMTVDRPAADDFARAMLQSAAWQQRRRVVGPISVTFIEQDQVAETFERPIPDAVVLRAEGDTEEIP